MRLSSALCGGLLALVASCLQADPLPGAPLDGVACEACHLVTNGRSKVPNGQAHLILEAQELLCSDCHRSAIETGHPSGFAPERTLPPEYPLDFTGFLTCSSCHWIHEPAHGAMRTGATVSESCLGCHEY